MINYIGRENKFALAVERALTLTHFYAYKYHNVRTQTENTTKCVKK